jgi:glycosyltransferase involved in cell wall biosynthesis
VALGRLSPEKGQDVFLEAAREVAARVPGARFVLAGEPFRPGDTAYEARLRAMADTPPLSGRVDFTGFHAEVPRLLAGAALVCVPSRSEGLGIAALEAMAARRAVIASALGGFLETVVSGETGLLVPPEDPRLHAAAMIELLQDPSRRARLGEAGRARVAGRFTHAIMTGGVTALYDELTGS